VTGILIAPEGTLAGKKVELLLEAAPKARRIVFLAPPDPAIRHQFDEARKAASRHGVDVVAVEVGSGDYDRAFAASRGSGRRRCSWPPTRASRATGGR